MSYGRPETVPENGALCYGAKRIQQVRFEKDVSGVGAVSRAEYINEYLLLGCMGVQVGVALFKSEDPHVLQRLGEDWANMYG